MSDTYVIGYLDEGLIDISSAYETLAIDVNEVDDLVDQLLHLKALYDSGVRTLVGPVK